MISHIADPRVVLAVEARGEVAGADGVGGRIARQFPGLHLQLYGDPPHGGDLRPNWIGAFAGHTGDLAGRGAFQLEERHQFFVCGIAYYLLALSKWTGHLNDVKMLGANRNILILSLAVEIFMSQEKTIREPWKVINLLLLMSMKKNRIECRWSLL